jgi:hypothetical protein
MPFARPFGARQRRLLILCLAPCLLWGGCGRKSAPGGAGEKTQIHKEVAPHGGTPVALGEDYNLELVRDADTGTLSGYVLDDEMENFIRSTTAAVTIVGTAKGVAHTLVLAAVANPATGETVGDSSLFQGQADWLKTTANFDGVVQGIAIRGTQFTDVKFNFPAGPAGE